MNYETYKEDEKFHAIMEAIDTVQKWRDHQQAWETEEEATLRKLREL